MVEDIKEQILILKNRMDKLTEKEQKASLKKIEKLKEDLNTGIETRQKINTEYVRLFKIMKSQEEAAKAKTKGGCCHCKKIN